MSELSDTILSNSSYLKDNLELVKESNFTRFITEIDALQQQLDIINTKSATSGTKVISYFL